MKNDHRSRWLTVLPFATLFGAACATTTPVELQNARAAYERASNGSAARETPADLHKAMLALQLAERTFADEEGSQKTIDYAYIAERSAQIAEARAASAIAMRNTAVAESALATKKEAIAAETVETLAKTQDQLAASQQGEALQSEKTTTERAAREEADRKTATERTAREEADRKTAVSDQKVIAAEQKLKESDEALAKLAAKQEARGMVITLSGSVMFRSSDSALLPGAQKRLDDVADALVTNGQEVVIEGHTDSRGSPSKNLLLSQRRADAVRSYLVSRGFPAEKITARGIGSDRPIGENTSSEGRANNRRVEIVIPKPASAAN